MIAASEPRGSPAPAGGAARLVDFVFSYGRDEEVIRVRLDAESRVLGAEILDRAASLPLGAPPGPRRDMLLPDMLGRVLFATAADTYDALAPRLRDRGFETTYAGDPNQALEAVDGDDIDVAVVAAELAGSGVTLCERILAVQPDARVIVLAQEPSDTTILAALRAGAFDFFAAPIDPAALEAALVRGVRRRHLRDEVARLRAALAETTGFEELIGTSQPMQRLYDLMNRAAETSSSVLITGESGTGKELVARALHRRSRRRDGPFVAVNCSAIPENLLETELFGHVRGAFTDAKSARAGLFVKASGGTVFLDEIGDMPLALQPKLLRALQERTVRPVGGDTEVAIDVRVIAATNHNLEALVTERQFREDLFYRINVIHIHVPPLRERASDILLLAQHYVEHYALQSAKDVTGVAPDAAEKLLAYDWPGNIRELQNCVERAVALTRDREVRAADLPDKIGHYRRSHVLVVSNDPSELVPLEEVERRYIARVLQAVHGNKKEAARVLGLDRKTLYRRLARYGIEVTKE